MAKKKTKTTRKGRAKGGPEPVAPVTPIELPAPIPLERVLGQGRAIRTLGSAIASDRLHHAWIFHGPRGVGKFTTAAALGALLLDPEAQVDLAGQLTADPESRAQRLVRGWNHPDLHVIVKELASVSRDDRIRRGKQFNIPKAVIEEFLIEPAQRTSAVSRGSLASKVFIVDEAELIDGRTQNSLLKTIEEPAPGCVVILVTSSEDRLLPTIRSRCQRVGFVSLGEREMHEWLGRQEAALSPEVAAWVIEYADGSPGVAKGAIENGLYEWHTTLNPMLDAVGRGRVPVEMAVEMAKLIGEKAEAAVKANASMSKDAQNKQWSGAMLALLARNIQQRLAKAAGAMDGDADASERTHRWLGALSAIAQAERQLASNVSLALVLENLVGQIAMQPEETFA